MLSAAGLLIGPFGNVTTRAFGIASRRIARRAALIVSGSSLRHKMSVSHSDAGYSIRLIALIVSPMTAAS
jgi:hypothetical protein